MSRRVDPPEEQKIKSNPIISSIIQSFATHPHSYQTPKDTSPVSVDAFSQGYPDRYMSRYEACFFAIAISLDLLHQTPRSSRTRPRPPAINTRSHHHLPSLTTPAHVLQVGLARLEGNGIEAVHPRIRGGSGHGGGDSADDARGDQAGRRRVAANQGEC